VPRSTTLALEVAKAALTVYYFGGRYFKRSEAGWLVADGQDAPWSRVSVEDVPASVLAARELRGSGM